MKYIKPEIEEIKLLSVVSVLCGSSENPWNYEEETTSHDIEHHEQWDDPGDY